MMCCFLPNLRLISASSRCFTARKFWKFGASTPPSHRSAGNLTCDNYTYGVLLHAKCHLQRWIPLLLLGKKNSKCDRIWNICELLYLLLSTAQGEIWRRRVSLHSVICHIELHLDRCIVSSLWGQKYQTTNFGIFRSPLSTPLPIGDTFGI